MKTILLLFMFFSSPVVSQTDRVVQVLILGEFTKDSGYIVAYKDDRFFLKIPKGYFGTVLELNVDDDLKQYDPFPLDIYRQVCFGRTKNESINILFEESRNYLIIENDRVINGRRHFSHYWHHEISPNFSIPELQLFYKLLK